MRRPLWLSTATAFPSSMALTFACLLVLQSEEALSQSAHRGAVRVDPEDCDLAYAAVLGDPYGPNEERGAYRSRDGGRNG
jgi:hypothetical protein